MGWNGMGWHWDGTGVRPVAHSILPSRPEPFLIRPGDCRRRLPSGNSHDPLPNTCAPNVPPGETPPRIRPPRHRSRASTGLGGPPPAHDSPIPTTGRGLGGAPSGHGPRMGTPTGDEMTGPTGLTDHGPANNEASGGRRVWSEDKAACGETHARSSFIIVAPPLLLSWKPFAHTHTEPPDTLFGAFVARHCIH